MTAPPQYAGRIRIQLSRFVGLLRGAGPEYPIALSIIALSIAAPILIRLSAAGSQSDIPAHAALAAERVRDGGWISYTLWFPLIYFTSSGSSDPTILRELSVFFLLIAVVAKTLLAYYFSWVATRHRAASAIIAVLMLVAMPLMNPWNPQDIYLGQISPNVWHNSTQIFALPFSLAAFIAALALLRIQTMPRAFAFGIMVLASTLAKPNYTLTLLPVLGLMLLWEMFRAKIRPARQVALVCVAFLPVALLLATQYLLVFGKGSVSGTVLTFAPLAVWRSYSTNIPVSIGLSIAGPFFVLLALPDKRRSDPALVLSWLVLAVSILQLALLAQRLPGGAIALDGNLFWGSYSAIFMVFITSAISLGKTYLSSQDAQRPRIALFASVVILTLHAGTGIYYVGRAGVQDFPVSRPLNSGSAVPGSLGDYLATCRPRPNAT